jgi:putative exosortase-associated protein (TIGR04073 family)
MGLSMKKLFKSLLVVSVLFFLSSQSAMAQSYTYASGEKFVGGLTNVVTGFVELPKNLINATEERGLPYGMTVGLATGIMHTVGRTVVGALDLVTFMIPIGSSVSPVYIWEDFHYETTYGTYDTSRR